MSETLRAAEKRLDAETRAKLALSKRVDELQEQLAAAAAASAAAAAAVSSHATDAASIHTEPLESAPLENMPLRRSRAARVSSKPPPLSELTSHNEQTNRLSKRSSAGEGKIDEEDEADSSPKRVRNSLEAARAVIEGEPAVKQSKFKQLRNTVSINFIHMRSWRVASVSRVVIHVLFDLGNLAGMAY